MPVLKDKDVVYAYGWIHDFFDAFGFADAVKCFNGIFQSAASGYIWKKGVPYDVVYFIEKLDTLVSAAFVIVQCGAVNDAVILNTPEGDLQPDMSLMVNFVGPA